MLVLARVAAAAAEAETRGVRRATRGRAGLREAAPSYRRGEHCTGRWTDRASRSWTKFRGQCPPFHPSPCSGQRLLQPECPTEATR